MVWNSTWEFTYWWLATKIRKLSFVKKDWHDFAQKSTNCLNQAILKTSFAILPTIPSTSTMKSTRRTTQKIRIRSLKTRIQKDLSLLASRPLKQMELILQLFGTIFSKRVRKQWKYIYHLWNRAFLEPNPIKIFKVTSKENASKC